AITQFTVTSVTLPEEVTQYYDKVTGMNMAGDNLAKFQQFNTAIAVSKEGHPAQQGVQQGVAMGMVLREMGAMQQPAASQPENNVGPPPEENSDIKGKLQQIKELFDGGLIDEEEYRNKKSELLSRL